MIQLELSRQETEMLISVLDGELGDLSYEIANTDRLDFRDKLKSKRAVLTKVRDSLTADCLTA